MASVTLPPAFPVWVATADGQSELVLDVSGYLAALATGAAPFNAITPAKTDLLPGGVIRTIAEVPRHSVQRSPSR